MKVSQLLEQLEGQDENAEVRIAIQPGYPLRLDVRDVVLGSEVLDIDPTDDDEVKDGDVVWIVANESVSYDESPYASRELWNR